MDHKSRRHSINRRKTKTNFLLYKCYDNNNTSFVQLNCIFSLITSNLKFPKILNLINWKIKRNFILLSKLKEKTLKKNKKIKEINRSLVE